MKDCTTYHPHLHPYPHLHAHLYLHLHPHPHPSLHPDFGKPPNGQGIVALMALKILDKLNIDDLEPNSPQYLHRLVEALRIAFADAKQYDAIAHLVFVFMMNDLAPSPFSSIIDLSVIHAKMSSNGLAMLMPRRREVS